MKRPIPKKWAVPEVFRERMGSHAGRQRTMAAEGHVLVILHDVPDPAEPDQRHAQLFWRDASGKWSSTMGGGIAALNQHLDTFDKVLSDLEERVETANSAKDYFSVLHVVSPTLRSVRNAQRALQQAREAVVDDTALIACRDRAVDLERTADLVRSFAKDGIEFTIARRSEEQAVSSEAQNVSAHRLNMIAALFLPIGAVGSVLGMNLEHGYETASAPFPFWGVTAACFLLGFGVRSLVTRSS